MKDREKVLLGDDHLELGLDAKSVDPGRISAASTAAPTRRIEREMTSASGFISLSLSHSLLFCLSIHTPFEWEKVENEDFGGSENGHTLIHTRPPF